MSETRTKPYKAAFSSLLQKERLSVLNRAMHDNARQLVRFVIAGAGSTVFYFLMLVLLTKTTALDVNIASAAAYCGAIFVSYRLQSRYTFRVHRDTTYQISSFLIASLFGLALSYGVMSILAVQLKIPALIVGALICVLIPALNYILFKYIIFPPHTSDAQPVKDKL